MVVEVKLRKLGGTGIRTVRRGITARSQNGSQPRGTLGGGGGGLAHHEDHLAWYRDSVFYVGKLLGFFGGAFGY